MQWKTVPALRRRKSSNAKPPYIWVNVYIDKKTEWKNKKKIKPDFILILNKGSKKKKKILEKWCGLSLWYLDDAIPEWSLVWVWIYSLCLWYLFFFFVVKGCEHFFIWTTLVYYQDLTVFSWVPVMFLIFFLPLASGILLSWSQTIAQDICLAILFKEIFALTYAIYTPWRSLLLSLSPINFNTVTRWLLFICIIHLSPYFFRHPTTIICS